MCTLAPACGTPSHTPAPHLAEERCRLPYSCLKSCLFPVVRVVVAQHPSLAYVHTKKPKKVRCGSQSLPPWLRSAGQRAASLARLYSALAPAAEQLPRLSRLSNFPAFAFICSEGGAVFGSAWREGLLRRFDLALACEPATPCGTVWQKLLNSFFAAS